MDVQLETTTELLNEMEVKTSATSSISQGSSVRSISSSLSHVSDDGIANPGINSITSNMVQSAQQGMENLKQFPRVNLSHLSTPLEYCPNLSKALGGVQIYIKRDDCTGLATGGNKARKLEFLMAQALKEGADYIITQGATQSNHARQTAAACAKLGLKCRILLEDRTGFTDPNYKLNGNVLLDDLFGATRETRKGGLDMNAEMEAVAKKFREEKNAKVYTIVGGGSNEIGALGYVNCAYELVQQLDEQGVDGVSHIVHATGSSGTQAGLVAGLKSMGSDIDLLGFGVRAPKQAQEEKVFALAEKVAEKIGCPGCVDRCDVKADCNYVGEGYGIPRDDTIEAIRMFAELEGLLLDPVYSAKGAAGLIDYCRKGKFKEGEKIVFIHTGGSSSLSGYINSFK